MSRAKRRWIELDWDNPDVVRAQDIPYYTDDVSTSREIDSKITRPATATQDAILLIGSTAATPITGYSADVLTAADSGKTIKAQDGIDTVTIGSWSHGTLDNQLPTEAVVAQRFSEVIAQYKSGGVLEQFFADAMVFYKSEGKSDSYRVTKHPSNSEFNQALATNGLFIRNFGTMGVSPSLVPTESVVSGAVDARVADHVHALEGDVTGWTGTTASGGSNTIVNYAVKPWKLGASGTGNWNDNWAPGFYYELDALNKPLGGLGDTKSIGITLSLGVAGGVSNNYPMQIARQVDSSSFYWRYYNSGSASWTSWVSIVGPTGATGPTGMTGPMGPTGMTGPQGQTGPRGIVSNYVYGIHSLAMSQSGPTGPVYPNTLTLNYYAGLNDTPPSLSLVKTDISHVHPNYATIGGVGAAGRMAYWLSDSALGSDANFLWDSLNDTLLINSTAANPGISIYSTAGGANLTVSSSTSNSYLTLSAGGNSLLSLYTSSTSDNSYTGISFRYSTYIKQSKNGSLYPLRILTPHVFEVKVSLTDSGTDFTVKSDGRAYYERVSTVPYVIGTGSGNGGTANQVAFWNATDYRISGSANFLWDSVNGKLLANGASKFTLGLEWTSASWIGLYLGDQNRNIRSISGIGLRIYGAEGAGISSYVTDGYLGSLFDFKIKSTDGRAYFQRSSVDIPYVIGNNSGTSNATTQNPLAFWYPNNMIDGTNKAVWDGVNQQVRITNSLNNQYQLGLVNDTWSSTSHWGGLYIGDGYHNIRTIWNKGMRIYDINGFGISVNSGGALGSIEASDLYIGSSTGRAQYTRYIDSANVRSYYLTGYGYSTNSTAENHIGFFTDNYHIEATGYLTWINQLSRLHINQPANTNNYGLSITANWDSSGDWTGITFGDIGHRYKAIHSRGTHIYDYDYFSVTVAENDISELLVHEYSDFVIKKSDGRAYFKRSGENRLYLLEDEGELITIQNSMAYRTPASNTTTYDFSFVWSRPTATYVMDVTTIIYCHVAALYVQNFDTYLGVISTGGNVHNYVHHIISSLARDGADGNIMCRKVCVSGKRVFTLTTGYRYYVYTNIGWWGADNSKNAEVGWVATVAKYKTP